MPRAHTVVGGFAGILILIGIIEAIFFFDLNLLEIVILAGVLILFYAILLAFLLRPKLVRVVKRREVAEKSEESMSRQIAKEIERPLTVNINNQPMASVEAKKSTRKKKTSRKKKSAR